MRKRECDEEIPSWSARKRPKADSGTEIKTRPNCWDQMPRAGEQLLRDMHRRRHTDRIAILCPVHARQPRKPSGGGFAHQAGRGGGVIWGSKRQWAGFSSKFPNEQITAFAALEQAFIDDSLDWTFTESKTAATLLRSTKREEVQFYGAIAAFHLFRRNFRPDEVAEPEWLLAMIHLIQHGGTKLCKDYAVAAAVMALSYTTQHRSVGYLLALETLARRLAQLEGTEDTVAAWGCYALLKIDMWPGNADNPGLSQRLNTGVIHALTRQIHPQCRHSCRCVHSSPNTNHGVLSVSVCEWAHAALNELLKGYKPRFIAPEIRKCLSGLASADRRRERAIDAVHLTARIERLEKGSERSRGKTEECRWLSGLLRDQRCTHPLLLCLKHGRRGDKISVARCIEDAALLYPIPKWPSANVGKVRWRRESDAELVLMPSGQTFTACKQAITESSPFFEGLLRWPKPSTATDGDVVTDSGVVIGEARGRELQKIQLELDVDPLTFRIILDHCHGAPNLSSLLEQACQEGELASTAWSVMTAADHFLMPDLIENTARFFVEKMRPEHIPVALELGKSFAAQIALEPGLEELASRHLCRHLERYLDNHDDLDLRGLVATVLMLWTTDGHCM